MVATARVQGNSPGDDSKVEGENNAEDNEESPLVPSEGSVLIAVTLGGNVLP